jgi:hypothetical protein
VGAELAGAELAGAELAGAEAAGAELPVVATLELATAAEEPPPPPPHAVRKTRDVRAGTARKL